MLCFAVFFGLFSVYDVLLLFFFVIVVCCQQASSNIVIIKLYDLNDCVVCSRKVGRHVCLYV